MNDDFEKTRRDFKKRNKYAAALREQGEMRGAFSLKVVDSRKQDYKRSKMKVTDIYDEEE